MQSINKAVIFESGNEEYAVPIQSVISIEKVNFINPIPHLPLYLKGVTKIREELLPVIDFEYVLYKRMLSSVEEARLLIVQTNSLPVGLLVKEAKEIIEFPDESVRQVNLISYESTRFFSGVATIGDRLITIIDVDVLVSSLEGIEDVKDFMTEAKDDQ
ncbi:chemotaxis protein CheW [Bacillus sp. FJAT-52991]|uniref:Chemotaxis protein CheW n=1 Tax=Bacillus kandeliae TaxID=3129297 RepID=A0ABZ2N335_9BACI